MIKWIVLAIVVVIVIYNIYVYNKISRRKIEVDEAFSTMDVYLKKRWDVIPNLVDTIKGYMGHEKELIEDVVRLRNSVIYEDMSVKEKIEVNSELSTKVGRLLLHVEAYPDLKASVNFSTLQEAIVKIEDEISNARKYYNAAVKVYNIAVVTFPSSLFARIYGFKTLEMYVISDEERKDSNMEF